MAMQPNANWSKVLAARNRNGVKRSKQNGIETRKVHERAARTSAPSIVKLTKAVDSTASPNRACVNLQTETKQVHVARRVRELEEHRPVAKLPSSIQAAKYVALDCEMVGVHTIVPASSSSGSSSTTQTSSRSVLARISIVNFYGTLLYDSYVSPPERITDFRTTITGITPQQLKTAKPLLQVLHEVDDIIKDKIIIGHGLENDFKVLHMNYPKRLIRDTSRYKYFRTKYAAGRTPSLRKLAQEILKKSIQSATHDSVEDARCALEIYKLYRTQWEKSLSKGNKLSKSIN